MHELTRIKRLSLVTMLTLVPATASIGQVQEVVVGVTPHCPYGLEACFGVASAALGKLQGVDSVAAFPDTYNCTVKMALDEGILPDLILWRREFRAAVGELQSLRGVELTMKGTVSRPGNALMLSVPGVRQPVRLVRLKHKLQWNFRKNAARGPEPEERAAFQQLVAAHSDAKAGQVKFEVTGPLRRTPGGLVLEVREFFPIRD